MANGTTFPSPVTRPVSPHSHSHSRSWECVHPVSAWSSEDSHSIFHLLMTTIHPHSRYHVQHAHALRWWTCLCCLVLVGWVYLSVIASYGAVPCKPSSHTDLTTHPPTPPDPQSTSRWVHPLLKSSLPTQPPAVYIPHLQTWSRGNIVQSSAGS